MAAELLLQVIGAPISPLQVSLYNSVKLCTAKFVPGTAKYYQ